MKQYNLTMKPPNYKLCCNKCDCHKAFMQVIDKDHTTAFLHALESAANQEMFKDMEFESFTLDVEGTARLSAAGLNKENIPRRICVDKLTPAEKAIYDAVQAVELAGADTRLTDAVNLLQAARDKVADFVDNVPAKRETFGAHKIG